MVGGVVIGLTRVKGRVNLHVADCPHLPQHHHEDCPNLDTCCVRTNEVRSDGSGQVRIELGDYVWWQGDSLLWTPRANRRGCRQGCDFDVKLWKLRGD